MVFLVNDNTRSRLNGNETNFNMIFCETRMPFIIPHAVVGSVGTDSPYFGPSQIMYQQRKNGLTDQQSLTYSMAMVRGKCPARSSHPRKQY